MVSAASISFIIGYSWFRLSAFAVAWGDMTSHVAGFVCSCILCLELRRQGAQRWELFVIGIGILVALGKAAVCCIEPTLISYGSIGICCQCTRYRNYKV